MVSEEVQQMGCHILGIKQLTEPMMTYCQSHQKGNDFIFIQKFWFYIKRFSFMKMDLQMSFAKWQSFGSDLG